MACKSCSWVMPPSMSCGSTVRHIPGSGWPSFWRLRRPSCQHFLRQCLIIETRPSGPARLVPSMVGAGFSSSMLRNKVAASGAKGVMTSIRHSLRIQGRGLLLQRPEQGYLSWGRRLSLTCRGQGGAWCQSVIRQVGNMAILVEVASLFSGAVARFYTNIEDKFANR